jgi:hypothetical protein
MWVEAVLLRDDLDRLVAQFAPMTIPIGAGHLLLSDPSPCVPVPDVGLRVECKARVHWPVLGIPVPITVHSLTMLVRPEVAAGARGSVLVFKLEIEAMDLAGIPAVLAPRITGMVNDELARRQVELSWDFGSALTHSFHLPESMQPLGSLDLTVLAGRVMIRSDGIGLAVQLDSAVQRHAQRRAS